MQDAPSWLQRWRLQAIGNPELELFDQERQQQEHERLMGIYERGGPMGVSLSEQALALAERLLEAMTPIGLGPAYPSRIEGISYRPWLWVSRNNPQQILLALHEFMPPFLWFATGQDQAALYTTLERDIAQETSPTLEFERTARAFLGTEDLIGAPDLSELQTHLSINPFIEPLFWGSAHAQDPWPEEIPTEALEDLGGTSHDQLRQAPLSVPTLSARTIISRSVISVEEHEGVFVVQVRYEPASHQEQIQALNAQFGSHYPHDLPLDVVAALLGFYFEDAQALLAFITEAQDAEEIGLYMHILACVRHGEVGLAEVLRPWLEHRDEQARMIAAEIALRQGFRPLVQGRQFSEPDDELRDYLIERLTTFDDEADETLSEALPSPAPTTNHALIIPMGDDALLDRLGAMGLMLTEDRRLRHPLVRRRAQWSTRSGTITYEALPALMAASLSGDLPEWVEGITLEDLRGVISAEIPIQERLEAVAQLGALARLSPSPAGAHALMQELLTQPRAELQLGVLALFEHLPCPKALLPTLMTLASSGTLLVKPAAARALTRAALERDQTP